MTDFREVLFDPAIGKNSTGEARWSTDVVQESTPNESRNQNWEHAVWEWNLKSALRTQEQWEYAFHFFNGVAQGRLYGFRWKCKVFNTATDSIQTSIPLLGTGNGTVKTFQIKRKFGIGAYAWSMPVNKPVSGTVKIYIDSAEIPSGHATYGWSVSTTTGVVTFASAANISGKDIYCDFEFNFPVRFDSDSIGSSWVDYRLHQYDIPIVSLKPVDYTL
jgi:uncharacterized protein (TIGR02217 family)